mmetsp:Transcript_61840/g.123961  ORF Transcript_61840/g.123961 Transcript_61840/m.123961 type:complete len:278 (-) Transcript_61840:779-1612(-)
MRRFLYSNTLFPISLVYSSMLFSTLSVQPLLLAAMRRCVVGHSFLVCSNASTATSKSLSILSDSLVFSLDAFLSGSFAAFFFRYRIAARLEVSASSLLTVCSSTAFKQAFTRTKASSPSFGFDSRRPASFSVLKFLAPRMEARKKSTAKVPATSFTPLSTAWSITFACSASFSCDETSASTAFSILICASTSAVCAFSLVTSASATAFSSAYFFLHFSTSLLVASAVSLSPARRELAKSLLCSAFTANGDPRQGPASPANVPANSTDTLYFPDRGST